MKPSEFLTEAKALVEAGWTQGVYARDDNGYALASWELSDIATCYCALGAMKRVRKLYDKRRVYQSARTYFERAIGTSDIPGWNDNPERTQGEVVGGFDIAIAVARENER